MKNPQAIDLALPAAAEIYFSGTDLSENETKDNVSMKNFKNNLAAFERQDGRGGNTPWQ